MLEPMPESMSAETPEAGRRYRVEAISRAAQVISCLEAEPGLDVASIAARAQATEAFVNSTLSALERRGLARREESGWSLGLAWLGLAAVGRRQIDLRELAIPVMRRMRDDVDETIILSVSRGLRRVNIEFMESTQEVRRITQVGEEIPLYLGATGRALLAGFSPRELRAYLESVAAADGMVISGLDVEAFAREVAATRASGRALVAGEFTTDLTAVSAPVRDHSGRVVAALTISWPADRPTPRLAESCARSVVSGAEEISRLIGFAGDMTKYRD